MRSVFPVLFMVLLLAGCNAGATPSGEPLAPASPSPARMNTAPFASDTLVMSPPSTPGITSIRFRSSKLAGPEKEMGLITAAEPVWIPSTLGAD